jgi:hypothetical protein
MTINRESLHLNRTFKKAARDKKLLHLMKNILKYLPNKVFGSSMILVTVEVLKTASVTV